MRIPLTESDLLVIRKAVKLFRKISPNKPKQSSALDQFAIFLGYFDYKQIKRLLIETPLRVSDEALKSLHQSISEKLSNEGLLHDEINIATDSFKLKKLSAFCYQTSNYPSLVNGPHFSNAMNNNHPIIMDEFFTGFNYPFKRKEVDKIIDVLSSVGSMRAEWWIPLATTEINTPSVVVFNKLIPLVETLLSTSPFSKDSHLFWEEETKTAFSNHVKSLWPEAMISGVDAIAGSVLKIKPFGFDVTVSNAEPNAKQIYALTHNSIYAIYPVVWDSYEAASHALAQLLLTRRAPTVISSSVSGNFTFGTGNTVKIEQGKINHGISLLPHLNLPAHITNSFDHEFLSIHDGLHVPHNGHPPKRYSGFPFLVKNVHLKPWVSNEVIDNLRTHIDTFSKLITNAKSVLLNSDLSILIPVIRDVAGSVYDDESVGHLNIDDPKEFIDEFPSLAPFFSDTILDNWHFECAALSEYPGRTYGNINTDQAEMVGFIIHKLITGNKCEYEKDRDIGAIIAAQAIQAGGWFNTDSELINIHHQYLKRYEELYDVATRIKSLDSAVSDLRSCRDILAKGKNMHTMTDMRSVSQIPVRVAQNP